MLDEVDQCTYKTEKIESACLTYYPLSLGIVFHSQKYFHGLSQSVILVRHLYDFDRGVRFLGVFGVTYYLPYANCPSTKSVKK